LSLAWMDYHPHEDSHKGNLVAIGTFETGIDIWDLDTIDVIEPVTTLGGEVDKSKDKSTSALSKSKKKKAQDLAPGSHTSSVLGLSWNKIGRYIIASCSADKSVKIWDISKGACVQTLNHHKDKVQSVSWHPVEAAIILSGSFDKTAAVSDARNPKLTSSCKLSADVECLQWNVHNPEQFLVNTESGEVNCFDSRSMNKALWVLSAHDKPASALAVNPVIPGLIATGSTDNTVKLWSIDNGVPKNLQTIKSQIPVFTMDFCADSPHLLAYGGSSESDKAVEADERLKIVKINDFAAVKAYTSKKNK